LSADQLRKHYGTEKASSLKVCQLPIVRKNNIINLTWNRIFFSSSQRFIKKLHPDIVIVSVLKQGAYHFSRKVLGSTYVYEVHQLSWYPNMSIDDTSRKAIAYEKSILENADLVTVTTHQLKNILLLPPYSLTNRIEIVPLAIRAHSLPTMPSYDNTDPLTLAYVGQLYKGQGVENLIDAIAGIDNIKLIIIGGNTKEIAQLSKRDARGTVKFYGFQPPAKIHKLITSSHAFVAPFEPTGRMPYVAHTKLLEYSYWKRPVIAPDLPIVKEHFLDNSGALLYKPGSAEDLRRCIKILQCNNTRKLMQIKTNALQPPLSWENRSSHYSNLLESSRQTE